MNATDKTKAEEAAAEDVSALSDELAKLRKDISALVDNVGRIGRERAEAIAGSEKLSEGLAAGEAALSDFAAELRKIEKDIAASTRRGPWRALGIAALAGLIVGLVLRR